MVTVTVAKAQMCNTATQARFLQLTAAISNEARLRLLHWQEVLMHLHVIRVRVHWQVFPQAPVSTVTSVSLLLL